MSIYAHVYIAHFCHFLTFVSYLFLHSLSQLSRLHYLLMNSVSSTETRFGLTRVWTVTELRPIKFSRCAGTLDHGFGNRLSYHWSTSPPFFYFFYPPSLLSFSHLYHFYYLPLSTFHNFVTLFPRIMVHALKYETLRFFSSPKIC